jgi:hypothetical protein
MRDEWLEQMKHPFTYGRPTGLSKADFDVDDTRICKESVRDGFWVVEEKPTNEARYENFGNNIVG